MKIRNLNNSIFTRMNENSTTGLLKFDNNTALIIEVEFTDLIDLRTNKLNFGDYIALHDDIKTAMEVFKDFDNESNDYCINLRSNEISNKLLKYESYFKKDEAYYLPLKEYQEYLARVKKEELEKELPVNAGPKEKKTKI